MSSIHVNPIGDAHSYTRSRTPWKLEDKDGRTDAQKLYHYLSGGGAKAFGRSVKQEETDQKRTRFLVVAAVVGLVWLVLLVV
jgi:hypothetical protein